MKYNVMGIVDANVTEDIEAHSPEEAAEQASLYAAVCHQCSREIYVGDVYEIRVFDEDGEEVYRSEPDHYVDATRLAAYLKTATDLPDDIRTIVEKY